MPVEFHLAAFNIGIVLNVIYSIDNSIIPFVKYSSASSDIVRIRGFAVVPLSSKDTGDAENSVDYCPPLVHDVGMDSISSFPSPSGYLPVFGIDKQKAVKQSVGKEFCTENFLQHICLY